MSEWKEYRLGELVSINARSIDRYYPYKNIEYLDTGSITRGKIEGFQSFDVEHAPSRAKRLVNDNDIIYSTVRPIQRHYGIVKNPKPNLVVSTGFAILSCDEKKTDANYIYFFLSSDEIVNYLDMVADGSTSAYPSLTPDVIADMDILLPPLPEQKSIASILSSLDDKIDLLHRQSKTLEALAETLFRQWFVDEAEEGWEKGKLGDVIELIYGKALKEEIRSGSGFPVIGSSGVVGYHSEFLVEGPGIVIGRKGTLGKVIYLFESFFPIDTTYYVKSRVKSVGMFYEYFLLKTLNFEDMNSDSAVPGLNRDIALSAEIKIAPFDKLKQYNTHCASLFEKLKQNNSQIGTLTRLRDTLLPKLMSGEIRVKDTGRAA
ncbi:MAG: restriction endonuclease subunit S [Nitrospirae bacterium]|nr:restriction endonuclease subunit S [Nitrospirota bacterium]